MAMVLVTVLICDQTYQSDNGTCHWVNYVIKLTNLTMVLFTESICDKTYQSDNGTCHCVNMW